MSANDRMVNDSQSRQREIIKNKKYTYRKYISCLVGKKNEKCKSLHTQLF